MFENRMNNCYLTFSSITRSSMDPHPYTSNDSNSKRTCFIGVHCRQCVAPRRLPCCFMSDDVHFWQCEAPDVGKQRLSWLKAERWYLWRHGWWIHRVSQVRTWASKFYWGERYSWSEPAICTHVEVLSQLCMSSMIPSEVSLEPGVLYSSNVVKIRPNWQSKISSCEAARGLEYKKLFALSIANI